MDISRFLFWVCSLALLLCFSCKNESKPITSSASSNKAQVENPAFQLKNVKQKVGDCQSESNCLEVNVIYPVLSNFKKEIQDQINESIKDQVISSMEMEDESTEGLTIEETVQVWVESFKEYLSDEIENDAKWYYKLAGSGTIYKHFAVVALPVSVYTGGAHPNFFQYSSNYNLHTGEEIEFEDIILDIVAFKKTTEEAFYKAVKEKDQEADKSMFFWDKPFYLPENFTITEKGLKLYYNPYEAAAYVFGKIEFTIPYEELTGVISLPE